MLIKIINIMFKTSLKQEETMNIINEYLDNKKIFIKNNCQPLQKFDEKTVIQNGGTSQRNFDLELTPSQSLIKLIDELTAQTPNCWEVRSKQFFNKDHHH